MVIRLWGAVASIFAATGEIPHPDFGLRVNRNPQHTGVSISSSIRYRDMLETMREAEASMQPVLTAFQDQVLYLKHNLNAQAISGLQASSVELQEQTRQLIADMQRSIDEADAFIEAMRSE